jgi:hypothetical protein
MMKALDRRSNSTHLSRMVLITFLLKQLNEQAGAGSINATAELLSFKTDKNANPNCSFSSTIRV